MSRRAVKTINQNLDLSQILKKPEELPAQWSSETIFERQAPLELEIGSGKGLFLRQAADQFPEHNFIGIEIGQKYARFSAARLYNRKNRNAIIVCGDAAKVLHDQIPDNLLSAVHVYFPDPWWKRAHRKRRILRSEVLLLIERRLQPNGTFHFWTDVEEYFLSTLKLITANSSLIGPFDVPEKEAEHNFDYRTHFERRTRLHGEKVYRVMFRKPLIRDC
ncbi:MAG: tRNA (guanosine(46)-N7)-methyltransferase TrmB [Planctomycetaceae bacterium]|jgi:tRNA (guanine-N7-)-methyltransferase|nr:tRNA (guanosine(46)-N7)-methyltransferase TrmB [Planctomycetaceae bacterium]